MTKTLYRIGLRTGTALALSFAAALPLHAAELAPEATTLIKGMSDYLEGLPAVSVGFDINTDVVLTSGEKHKLSSSGTVTMRRPGEIHVTRRGERADTEVVYDGKTLSAIGHGPNAYFQTTEEGTVDTLIDTLRGDHGIEAPAADFFASKIYDGLMMGAESATYYGTAWIDGTACHHVGVRTETADWQIWIEADETPLPCQYVITSKWVAGSPEHSIRFYGWNAAPEIAPATFAFMPPEGARRIETLPADEIGALMNGATQ